MDNKKVRHSHRRVVRTILILLPIVIIVAGAGIGVYVYVNSLLSSGSVNTTTTKGSSAKSQSIATSYKTAQAVVQTDGVAAGQKILDKELVGTTVPAEKASIYSAKVALADSTGNGDLIEMISFALQADQLAPTADSAALLGNLYHRAKDKDNAIRYFTLAIERVGDVTKADQQTQGNYSYYQSALEAIKNGA